MADIFLSYKSDERERVAPIVAHLEAEGWTVFWDRKTPVGMSWSEFIHENLMTARAVVVAWSRASVSSHWVQIEAGKGRDRQCLIPLKLDEVMPPFGFEHLQAADFTRWTRDTDSEEWRALTEAIDRLVPRSTASAGESRVASETDVSSLWERLLTRPTVDEMRQLRDEVAALRQADPTDAALIKLQRRVNEAIEQAVPAAPAPAKGGKHPLRWAAITGVAVVIVAVIALLVQDRRKPDPVPTDGPTQPAASLSPSPPAADAAITEEPASSVDGQRAPRDSDNGLPLPELVDVPAGCFEMGSPDGQGYDNERPQHRVCLEAFQLGRYEVTFDEYDAYARAEGRDLPGDNGWGRGQRPVINVSWHDAQGYVAWLSSQTGKQCRLPSEAEWEYAARAGTTTRYALPAPDGSDDIAGKGLANCEGCGSRWDNQQTAPVGRFPANDWGLHDMHGNVWEWVQDHYHASYEGAPGDGSAWVDPANKGGRRALRGGSWFNSPDYARASFRGWRYPVNRRGGLGFRVLCSSLIAR